MFFIFPKKWISYLNQIERVCFQFLHVCHDYKDLRGDGQFNDEIHSLHSNENGKGICPFYGENKGAKPFESFNSLFSGSSRRTN